MEQLEERPKKRRWTPEEEVEFWLQLVEAWQEGDPGTWLQRFEGEGLEYLKFLCTDAFQKAYAKNSAIELRSLPSDEEIWGEVLVWFAETDRNFVNDIVYGGMEYAGRKNGKAATIQDCLSEIRNRVYQRVISMVFKKWLRNEVGTSGQIKKKREGVEVRLDEEKGESERTWHDLLADDGVDRFYGTVEGRELVQLGERVVQHFFDSDLATKAERVVVLFRLSAFKNGISTLPKAVTEGVCDEVGIKGFRRVSEIYNSAMALLGSRIRESDSIEFSESERGFLGVVAMEHLEAKCLDWVFSENQNEGLFTWYERLTNEEEHSK